VTDLPGLIKEPGWGGSREPVPLRRGASDALLHVVDRLRERGQGWKIADPGTGDPLADLADVELELVLWYTKLFSSNMVKISKTAKLRDGPSRRHRGSDAGDRRESGSTWSTRSRGPAPGKGGRLMEREGDPELLLGPPRHLQPTLIIANKMDLPNAAENFKASGEKYKG